MKTAPELVVPNKQSLGTALDNAFYELSNRGLLRAARWAADAAAGLDIIYEQQAPPCLPPQTMQAKAYFDCKEYARAWNVLEHAAKQHTIDSTGRFLRLFARYHYGEALREDMLGSEIFVDRSKQEDSKPLPVNPYIGEIQSEIAGIPVNMVDAHILYLEGVLLRAKHEPRRAIDKLVRSCIAFPYNWSCWMELKSCFTRLVDADEVLTTLAREFKEQSAEAQVAFEMFRCYASEELDPALSASIVTKYLIPLFPRLPLLQTQLARIYNSEGHYEASTVLFERVLKSDPFRIEDLDAFSNLLYVTDQRSKLAFLAQHVSQADKYRTESCCIIANYYSLRGEHERAVEYYKRAIVLNRNYMSAWTLMGHEFIELGNPQAAIETYRTAVDLASYDFRPWFGLGQAYEVLSMHYFAQYYFQRALALRPGDVRLWDALANCYELLDKDEDALNAYQQAFQISEGDVYYGFRLGLLHDRVGNAEQALKHITACAQSEDGELAALPSGTTAASDNTALHFNAADPNTTTPTTAAMAAMADEEMASEWPSRARLWLAKRCMNQSDWAGALHWVRKVNHGTREMLEEARALEREVRFKVMAPN